MREDNFQNQEMIVVKAEPKELLRSLINFIDKGSNTLTKTGWSFWVSGLYTENSIQPGFWNFDITGVSDVVLHEDKAVPDSFFPTIAKFRAMDWGGRRTKLTIFFDDEVGRLIQDILAELKLVFETRESGPAANTEIRAVEFKRIKDENPSFTQHHVALAYMEEFNVTGITEHTVRNTYRAMRKKCLEKSKLGNPEEWVWVRGNRIR